MKRKDPLYSTYKGNRLHHVSGDEVVLPRLEGELRHLFSERPSFGSPKDTKDTEPEHDHATLHLVAEEKGVQV